MNLQDQHPIDSTISGLNNKYQIIGDRSHFIDSESIHTCRRCITKTKQYLLASAIQKDSKVIVRTVQLLHAYYLRGYVHLFFTDVDTDRVLIITICLESSKKECDWVLFELYDQAKLRDYIAIKSYCENCAGSDKTGETNLNNSKTDLKEIDF
jgi:hypothetical protein